VNLGLSPHDLAVVGDSAVEVAPVLVGDAAVKVCVGEVGVEPDCLVEVGDGTVVIILSTVGGAAVAEGHDVPGIEPDRLGKVGDRTVEVALVLVRDPPIVVGVGKTLRGFAATLDDARAGGDAAIRIIPLASVPVDLARGQGRGCDRKQRNGPDKDPQ
jgi:hypothetical protein